ncbi:MAG: hypothetical protein K1X57_13920 [Gemmataceae bacterium]|nr:hypothetical protein [Gemmataceae bacterium]
MKKVALLWHGPEPIGICVFCAPAASVTARSRYFGIKSAARGDVLAGLTRQLWTLSRVVLHPTYRGAGIAAAFVRRACELCPVPWIEALAVMGRVNPFFEKAGFTRTGGRTRAGAEYFIRDNRGQAKA